MRQDIESALDRPDLFLRAVLSQRVILSRLDGEGSPSSLSTNAAGDTMVVRTDARSFGALRQPQDENTLAQLGVLVDLDNA